MGGCSRGTACNSVFPAAGAGGTAENQQISHFRGNRAVKTDLFVNVDNVKND